MFDRVLNTSLDDISKDHSNPLMPGGSKKVSKAADLIEYV